MARDEPSEVSSLQRMPSLVLNRITLFCRRKALRNLRLTCHALSYEATRTLFSLCHLKPTEQSIQKFESIRAKPELAKWVKTLCLKTYVINHVCFDYSY